ncbi:MAG: FeoB-associated Cys-rich membrane protein [Clostridia bacterium]|nr:FeoB-associated Cys-rich membrane protein [Clostridia bacterium]MBR0444309.1 FeoB-associated Cys-rich membrane protein [Clostridia bacterium]
MSWLANNLGTIIVALILIAVISLAVARLVKNRRSGKSSCGCNCAHCAMAESCHKQSNK